MDIYITQYSCSQRVHDLLKGACRYVSRGRGRSRGWYTFITNTTSFT